MPVSPAKEADTLRGIVRIEKRSSPYSATFALPDQRVDFRDKKTWPSQGNLKLSPKLLKWSDLIVAFVAAPTNR